MFQSARGRQYESASSQAVLTFAQPGTPQTTYLYRLRTIEGSNVTPRRQQHPYKYRCGLCFGGQLLCTTMRLQHLNNPCKLRVHPFIGIPYSTCTTFPTAPFHTHFPSPSLHGHLCDIAITNTASLKARDGTGQ